MRNFIGSLLIGLAEFIIFMHNVLIFFIMFGIIIGILTITLISFFDLISPDMNVLGKTHWDIIVLIIGCATMWMGILKLGAEPTSEKNDNFN